jgi:hypothetical protein
MVRRHKFNKSLIILEQKNNGALPSTTTKGKEQ